MNFGQNQEAANRHNDTVFPVESPGRRQPEVEAEEQTQRQLEQPIDECKDGALGDLKPGSEEDNLRQNNEL